MPPLPDAILLMWAPWAPRFSRRVWGHAPWWRLGAIVAPGARTVTAAWRVMGRALAQRFTHDHRGLNRAPGSALHAADAVGGLVAHVVPLGARMVLGAEEPVARRRARQITATGCDREAVRSTQQHVIRGCGWTWVVRRLVVPGPWAPRGWAAHISGVRGM